MSGWKERGVIFARMDELRKLRNLCWEDLADRAGIACEDLFSWKERLPDVRDIFSVCEAIGTDAAHFFDVDPMRYRQAESCE